MTNKDKIISESKRIEEDSLYSSKSHFNASQCWTNIHLWLSGTAAVLSAIAGTSAFSQFNNHNILAGILSIIAAGLTAIITFVNPNDQAEIHQKAGNSYNSLRNDARIFYEIEINNIKDEKMVENLKKLNNRRSKLNLESAQIPKWAFQKAKEGINEGQAEYKIDKK